MTVTRNNEPLPCPFCGSTVLKSGGDDKVVGFWCLTCEAAGPNHYGSHEWNDRASRSAEAGKPVVKGPTKAQIETLANNIHNNDSYEYTVECLTHHLSALSTPADREPVAWPEIVFWNGAVAKTPLVLAEALENYASVQPVRGREVWAMRAAAEFIHKLVASGPLYAAPVADSEPNESEIIEAMLANEPFVFDPATNFIHADDGGAPEHGIKYVPAPVADREPVSVPNDVLNDMLLARAPDCRWTIASILKEHGLNRRQRLDYMRSALAAAAPQPNPSKVDALTDEQLREENNALRQIIHECAERLPNGAFISPKASIEFMRGLPKEIASVCAALAAQGDRP